MISAPGEKPDGFDDLFEFYNAYVKLLYSSVQAEGELPTETLFELNAALDHVSRYWVYGDEEEVVVDKAYAHLKRSCLDIFKIKLKETTAQYKELRRVDVSLIDNGEFQSNLHQLWQDIKKEATEARRSEGKPSTYGSDTQAFERWEPVFTKCCRLEQNFYFNNKVEWARRKTRALVCRERIIVFALGVFSSALVSVLIWLL